MNEVISKAGSGAQDEAEIRRLAAAWSKALEEKDIDGLVKGYVPDALLFDVKPPYQTQGVDAIRRLWEACLPYFPARYKSERRDFKVMVGGDAAFAHCLHHIQPIGEESRAGETWIRVTICYQKIDGRWHVVHEHVSVPFDPMTGQVSFITDPDSETPLARKA